MRKTITFLFFVCCCLFISQGLFAQTSQTFTSSGSFVVPAGVTQLTVETWGGGGRGASATVTGTPGGGGGGGAYSTSVITVVPGNTYYIVVGAGGDNTDVNGQNSEFRDTDNITVLVLGRGGFGVATNSSTGALGAVWQVGDGDAGFNGGNGASGIPATSAGGGGSSAGTAANGTNAVGGIGGVAPAGGGDGADGPTAVPWNGLPGDAPGGGGSGVRMPDATARQGGLGGDGQVILQWDCEPPTYINVTNLTWYTSSTAPASNCSAVGDLFDGVTGYDGVNETPIIEFSLDNTFTSILADPDDYTITLPGVTTVYVRARNSCGNVASSFTVTVEDDEPPVIDTCPADDVIEACISTDAIADEGHPAYSESVVTLTEAEFVTAGGAATDNCGIDYVEYVDVSAGDCPLVVTRTWTVYDLEGLTAVCTQVFTIDDTTPPTLAGNLPVAGDQGSVCYDDMPAAPDVAIIAAEYFDACSTVTATLSSTLATGTDCGWTVTYTYSVTDDCGNETVVDLVYFGADVTDPELADPLVDCSSLNVDDNNWCYDVAENFDASVREAEVAALYTDNCGVVTATWQGLSFTVMTGDDCDWTATYYFDVDDGCGNIVVCSITYTGGDTTDPVFDNIPANALPASNPVGVWTFNAPAVACEALVSWTTVTGSDTECVTAPVVVSVETDPPVALDIDPYPATTSGNFPVGSTTVTYTVTDNCGNATSTSFVVIVNDITSPTVAGCPGPITVNNTPGVCEATVSWAPPSITDACGIVSTSVSHLPGSVFPVGVTTVTYTGTDPSGNTSTCTFTVTVVDNEDPTFTCPVPANPYTAEAGVCYATLDFTVTDQDDNCGVLSTTYSVEGSPISFPYQFPVGTTTVTVVVLDINGNDAECSFVVVVEDDEDPVVTTQPWTLYLDAAGAAVLDPLDVFVSATDNCGIATATLAVSQTAFGCADLGVNVVTVTIEDIHGNIGSATAEVTVVDNLPPTISCFGTDRFYDTNPDVCTWTVPLAGAFPATWGLRLAPNDPKDNCGIETLTYNLTGASSGTGADIRGQVFNVGVTTVTWTAVDGSGNDASCSFQVTITDAQPPVFVDFPAPLNPYDTDEGVCTVSLTFTATADDNCGIDHIKYYIGVDEIFFPYDFELGTTEVLVVATDIHGLTVSNTFTVEVEDNEPPTIICPEDIVVDADPGACNEQVIWDRPVPFDNCVGVITFGPVTTVPPVAIQTYANPDPPYQTVNAGVFPVGVTSVTYTITDIHGNVNSCTFTVTVNSLTLPVALADDITLQLDEFGMVSLTPDEVDAGSSIACLVGPISPYLSLSQYDFDCSDVGENDVIFTVTDKSGQTATTTIVVTVQDLIPPVVTTEPTIDLYVDEFGAATLLPEMAYIVATDACGIVTSTMYVDPASFDCSDIGGPVTYTLYVEDVNGNWGSASGAVNVYDIIDPVMACTITGTLTVGTATNTCDYTHADDSWDLAATDNCGPVTPTYSLDGVTTIVDEPNTTLAGQVFALGITTVTWTVTDASGNAVSCTYVVNVIDDVFPTIACVTNTLRDNDEGECFYTTVGDEFDPDFGDNCPGATVENDYNFGATLAGETFPIGSTDVVWTVTDNAGNQTSCTITVVVEDVDDPVWDYEFILGKNCGDNVDLIGCNTAFSWRRPGLSDLSDCTGVVITESFSDPVIKNNVEAVWGVYNQNAPNNPDVNLPAGVYTITYTATDAYNNVAVCYFTITVTDPNPPIITACPQTRNLVGCTVDVITGPVYSEVMTETTWAVFAQAPNLGNGVDACMPIPYVYYQDAIVAGDACIVVERTWTLMDGTGNTATCTQTINIGEDVPPALIVEGTLPGGDLGNECLSAMPTAPLVADIAALYEDNCSTVTATLSATTYGPDNSDCGWIVTYTYSVVDFCLNETIADVVYFGGDEEAPSLKPDMACSDLDQTSLEWCLSVAEAFDPVTLESAVAALYEDNCTVSPTATWVDTMAGAQNTDCEWTFTYVFEISDDCENSVTCTVTYSGGDVDEPLLIGTLPGEVLLNVCYDDMPLAPDVSVIAAQYSDNCGTVTATLIGTQIVGDDCGWTVTYTYSVEDECENFAPNAVVVFSSSDTEGPVVENAEELQWNFSCIDEVPAIGDIAQYIEISDNCFDGPFGITPVYPELLLNNDCPQARIITRTYTITDGCGNPTTFVQVITILDEIAPELIDPLVDSSSLDDLDQDLCFAGAQAIDVSNLADRVAALYEDNCGTVTVTLLNENDALTGDDCGWIAVYVFEVADECFNSVTCTVTYSGSDQTAPSGSNTADLALVEACYDDALTAAPFSAAIAIQGYSDNCGGVVTATYTSHQLTGDDCGWTITYTFSVWDLCDNELANQTYAVSGSNSFGPELTGTPYAGQHDVNVCFDEALAEVPFDAELAVTGYEAYCPGGTVTAVLTDTQLTGDDCAWVITYTFTVFDGCGIGLASQTYTNSGGDTEDPEILGCNFGSTPIQVTVSSGCEYVIPDTRWDVTATDNCGTPQLSYTLGGATTAGPVVATTLQGVSLNTGTTVVTWYATDGCGHVVSCTFSVAVSVGPPTFIEPFVDDQIVNADAGLCTYTHVGDDWDPVVDEPCDPIALTYELSGATSGSGSTTIDGQLFNLGVTTVTWTATDAGSLTSTYTYTVTVRPVQLSGNVSYYNYFGADVPMPGITVQLLGAADNVLQSVVTNGSGNYLFDNQANLMLAKKVKVSTVLPHGGLSATDALAVQRIATSLPVSYWLPVTFLNEVGNVNVQGGVNIIDAVRIIDRLLYPTNSTFFFKDETVPEPRPLRDWTFYAPDQDVVFTYAAANAATIAYNFDICELDIWARAYGDVLGNYNLVFAKSENPVQTEQVQYVQPGEMFEIPVTLNAGMEISAMTLYLDYATDKLEVLEVQSALPGMRYALEDGSIRVAWTRLDPVNLAQGDAVITLVARTKGVVRHTDLVFSLGNQTSFADGDASPIENFELAISSIENTETTVGIDTPEVAAVSLEAYPNPFRHELNLKYAIPESGNVRISIVNILGAEVAQLVDRQHEAGVFNHTFNPETASMEYGVYFVRFEVAGETIQTSRIIKLVYMR